MHGVRVWVGWNGFDNVSDGCGRTPRDNRLRFHGIMMRSSDAGYMPRYDWGEDLYVPISIYFAGCHRSIAPLGPRSEIYPIAEHSGKAYSGLTTVAKFKQFGCWTVWQTNCLLKAVQMFASDGTWTHFIWHQFISNLAPCTTFDLGHLTVNV